MMNLKGLLSRNFLTRLAADHGEKGLFGLALLFLLACVVQAGRRESLSWTPEDLLGLTQAAQRRIQGTTPRPVRVVPYATIAARSARPVSEPAYALSTPFDPPVWPSVLRSAPELYPVRELAASAGRGAFAAAMAGPSGEYGTGTQGERWVCVTGLIEHHRQTEAFREALWQTSYHDIRKDRPDYVYFRVERAEVDPSRPESAIPWVRQNVRAMFLRQQSWPSYGPEPVDPRYFPPERSGISLVFPLGPLEDRPWGVEVCHPRIPLPQNSLAQGSGPVRRVRTSHQAAIAQEATEEPEFLLLRYFDYDVEPGKQYRYRVRLLLANPNHAVPAHCLEDDSAATRRYLETAWSEPTDVVRVPPDTEVLAGAARTWGARATVMMTRFLKSTGETACEEFQVRCGQLLDFEGVTALGSRGVLSGNQSVDYSSGMLLLDVCGGKRMPGRSRFTEPASLLLVDPLGNLVVRNELDDLPAYRAHQRARRLLDSTYADQRPVLRDRNQAAISLD